MLRELVSFMGEDMENESPMSTCRTPLDDSGSSPNYSSPSGKLPNIYRDDTLFSKFPDFTKIWPVLLYKRIGTCTISGNF